MSLIPLSFEWPEETYGHLEMKQEKEVFRVHWPSTGLQFISPTDEYPDHNRLKELNPGMTFHACKGFSLHQYHEFFVAGARHQLQIRYGTVEVTFGQATPLAEFLFDNTQEESFHGDWSSIESIRIMGVPADQVEAYLLNGLLAYEKKFDENPWIIEIDSTKLESWDGEESKAEIELRLPSPVIDIDPIRFLYRGHYEPEAESACLQLYRVLEYYSFFDLHSKIGALRNDPSISSKDFLRAVTQLLVRDEREAVCRFIGRVVGRAELQVAKERGLIGVADHAAFASALYEFRNSLVHGKFDQKGAISSSSVLTESPRTVVWRDILKVLATTAAEMNGQRRPL